MEEATGAPSSLADWGPKRLRASGRDGGAVMTQPPSPLTMLFSRHTSLVMSGFVKVFGCRPLTEGWRAHGRPASENLHGKKPREGRRGRFVARYGDLSAANAARD